MRYGHFDDDRREYVITRPDTPLPWINYLGTSEFFGVISNTAGGYCAYRDARLRRISRYRYNGVPADAGGRYLYLRDDDSGDYWSPTWQPTTQRELDSYECRHGLSYTQITSSYLGVRAECLYFVPPGETLEVWRLAVSNDRDVTVHLSVFSSVEFCLWDALDDASNFQRNYSTGEVEVADGVLGYWENPPDRKFDPPGSGTLNKALDAAFDYYRRINPSAREGLSEVHRCEPYVYAQMIAGKDAPTHGEAKNSWLTGAAAWNFVAISQWILGIRAEFDGLRIDPQLPSGWPGFKAVRRFRGATYRIHVAREGGAGSTVCDVLADGKPLTGTLLPLAPPGATVDVEVVLRASEVVNA
jgi:cellobiose phosphorylase